MNDVGHIFVIGGFIVDDDKGLDSIIGSDEWGKGLGKLFYLFMVGYPVLDADFYVDSVGFDHE